MGHFPRPSSRAEGRAGLWRRAAAWATVSPPPRRTLASGRKTPIVPPDPPPAAIAVVAPGSGRSLFFRVFPSIMLPMFLAVVDQTIVATALPAIAASLGQIGRASWVVIAYLIAATVAAPVYGQLGDVLCRKRMMFVALATFMVASILCASAVSIEILTAARI